MKSGEAQRDTHWGDDNEMDRTILARTESQRGSAVSLHPQFCQKCGSLLPILEAQNLFNTAAKQSFIKLGRHWAWGPVFGLSDFTSDGRKSRVCCVFLWPVNKEILKCHHLLHWAQSKQQVEGFPAPSAWWVRSKSSAFKVPNRFFLVTRRAPAVLHLSVGDSHVYSWAADQQSAWAAPLQPYHASSGLFACTSRSLPALQPPRLPLRSLPFLSR